MRAKFTANLSLASLLPSTWDEGVNEEMDQAKDSWRIWVLGNQAKAGDAKQ